MKNVLLLGKCKENKQNKTVILDRVIWDADGWEEATE